MAEVGMVNIVPNIPALKAVVRFKRHLVPTIVHLTNVCMQVVTMADMDMVSTVLNTNVQRVVVIAKNLHYQIIVYYTTIKGDRKNDL